jgi:hypothetical protein
LYKNVFLDQDPWKELIIDSFNGIPLHIFITTTQTCHQKTNTIPAILMLNINLTTKHNS